MKRSWIKRGAKGLKRSPLKRMSSEKSRWMDVYHATVDHFGPFVRCASSGLMLHRSQADPHHPFGRKGQYLLCFVWLNKDFHQHLHAHGTQSRALGWLGKPYSGGQYDPAEKRAWKPEFESHWPERFKRP